MTRQIDVSDQWRKQVDGDWYGYPPAPPLRGVAERLVQYQVGEGAHQAVLAHQWQELLGPTQSEYRGRPPSQCLGTHHVGGLQVDLRLVQHGQGTMNDGLAQVAEQSYLNQSAARQMNIGRRIARGAVVPVNGVRAERLQATAELFSRGQCAVSMFEQLGCAQIGVVEAGDRQACGESHEDDFAVSAKRSLEGLHDLVDDQMRILPGVLDEHREFIAAESGDGVTATHAAEQSLRGLHQQRVTGGLAQVVVDQLEVVDIHGQDCDRTLVTVIELDRVIKPVAEQSPVGQVSQRVAQRTVGHAVRQPPVFGDHQKLAGQHGDDQPGHYGERGV